MIRLQVEVIPPSQFNNTGYPVASNSSFANSTFNSLISGVKNIGIERSRDYNEKTRKFLHLTKPQNSLDQVAQEIMNRFFKLYPNDETLDINRLQDGDSLDLDPEYLISDVFGTKNENGKPFIIKVILNNELENINPEPIVSDRFLDASSSNISFNKRKILDFDENTLSDIPKYGKSSKGANGASSDSKHLNNTNNSLKVDSDNVSGLHAHSNSSLAKRQRRSIGGSIWSKQVHSNGTSNSSSKGNNLRHSMSSSNLRSSLRRKSSRYSLLRHAASVNNFRNLQISPDESNITFIAPEEDITGGLSPEKKPVNILDSVLPDPDTNVENGDTSIQSPSSKRIVSGMLQVPKAASQINRSLADVSISGDVSMDLDSDKGEDDEDDEEIEEDDEDKDILDQKQLEADMRAEKERAERAERERFEKENAEKAAAEKAAAEKERLEKEEKEKSEARGSRFDKPRSLKEARDRMTIQAAKDRFKKEREAREAREEKEKQLKLQKAEEEQKAKDAKEKAEKEAKEKALVGARERALNAAKEARMAKLAAKEPLEFPITPAVTDKEEVPAETPKYPVIKTPIDLSKLGNYTKRRNKDELIEKFISTIKKSDGQQVLSPVKCDPCLAKKRVCSKNYPHCFQCFAFGKTLCAYSDEKIKSFYEKSTKKKAKPSMMKLKSTSSQPDASSVKLANGESQTLESDEEMSDSPPPNIQRVSKGETKSYKSVKSTAQSSLPSKESSEEEFISAEDDEVKKYLESQDKELSSEPEEEHHDVPMDAKADNQTDEKAKEEQTKSSSKETQIGSAPQQPLVTYSERSKAPKSETVPKMKELNGLQSLTTKGIPSVKENFKSDKSAGDKGMTLFQMFKKSKGVDGKSGVSDSDSDSDSDSAGSSSDSSSESDSDSDSDSESDSGTSDAKGKHGDAKKESNKHASQSDSDSDTDTDSDSDSDSDSDVNKKSSASAATSNGSKSFINSKTVNRVIGKKPKKKTYNKGFQSLMKK